MRQELNRMMQELSVTDLENENIQFALEYIFFFSSKSNLYYLN